MTVQVLLHDRVTVQVTPLRELQLLRDVNALVAVSKCMWAFKLCSMKILQFLTGGGGCQLAQIDWYNGHWLSMCACAGTTVWKSRSHCQSCCRRWNGATVMMWQRSVVVVILTYWLMISIVQTVSFTSDPRCVVEVFSSKLKFWQNSSYWVTVLYCTRHKIVHFGDVLPSQCLGFVLKKLNLTEQKQATHEQNSKKNIQKANLNEQLNARTANVCGYHCALL